MTIEPKGQGMKKCVTETNSVHCTQPFWSPWRSSGGLRVWIYLDLLNNTWFSHRVAHSSFPAPHIPTYLEPALPCSLRATGNSPGCLSSSLLTASSYPTHNCPMRYFYSSEWTQAPFAQQCPESFLPGHAVHWQHAMGLRSTSSRVPATLSEKKKYF